MVQGESDSNGSDGRRRALPLFDPVAGMRAMAEVQAEGLRAASELLERMLGSGHDGPEARALDRDRRSADGGSHRRDGDYAALADAWAQLLQRIAAGLAAPVEPGPVTVPVDTGTVGQPVRLVLEHGRQTEEAEAEVWLHNGTSTDVGPLTLRCAALSAPDGEVLGAQVCFDPAEITLLPARSSRGVVISVSASALPPPGIYRGTVQAKGAPKLWLPIEVAVAPC